MLPRDFRSLPRYSCRSDERDRDHRALLRDLRIPPSNAPNPAAFHAALAPHHRRHHILAYCLLQHPFLKPGLGVPCVSWWDQDSVPRVHSPPHYHHFCHGHHQLLHQRSFHGHNNLALFAQGYFRSVLLSGSSVIAGHGMPPIRGMDTRYKASRCVSGGGSRGSGATGATGGTGGGGGLGSGGAVGGRGGGG
ncbi:POU domain, class 4, transcription factor 1-like, partial [Diprion similis]|uniref:POU domain, class 4, transcription factor 1-like n=1 Tax=Diprion similis TaxID=362088 RepID=UPI001EF8DA8E